MTEALEEGEWSAARPGRTVPKEKPGTHFTWGWVDPRADLDRCRKSRPHRDSIPDRPARSRYTEWTTRPTHKDQINRLMPRGNFVYFSVLYELQ